MGGLNTKLEFSDDLEDVTGKRSGTRAQATKWFWDYVKENDLQNPKNRREILCDSKLKKLCGKSKITMFQVGKVLSGHLS